MSKNITLKNSNPTATLRQYIFDHPVGVCIKLHQPSEKSNIEHLIDNIDSIGHVIHKATYIILTSD